MSLSDFGALSERAAVANPAAGEWHWQQDSQLRFTRYGDDGAQHPPFAAEKLGHARWEIPGATPLSGSWDDHRRALAAGAAFEDFQYEAFLLGQLRRFTSSGQPCYDASGAFAGYRGITRELSSDFGATPRQRLALRSFSPSVVGRSLQSEGLGNRLCRRWANHYQASRTDL